MRYAVAQLLQMPFSRRLTVSSLLILVLLHGANAIFIAKLVQSAQTTAADAMAARATLLAEHASRAIGGVDLALEDVASKAAAEPALGRRSVALHMLLHRTAASLPQVRALTILDANGVLIQDSRHYPAQRFSYADLPGFAEQKKWRGVGLYIEAPSLSKVDGKPYFAVTRPILDSGGDLRGVVAALVDPSYFMSFYGRGGNADAGMAALAREDGALLAAVVAPQNSRALIGMDVRSFFHLNPRFTSLVQPVSGLPLKIIVTTPPVWLEPSFRAYAAADAVFMAMLTLLVALGTAKLVREAGAREHAELRLRDAINNVPAGFALFDADDRLLMCNSSYRELFSIPDDAVAPNISFEDALGLSLRHGIYGSPADVERRLAQHRTPSGETVQKLAGGRWVLTRWRRTNAGGMVYFHSDITQVKQQEEALRAAGEAERVARERAEEADRAKSAFLATMSHELRTPLNAVIGFAELIAQEAFGSVLPRYREYGALIVRSGRHLLKIINDILDLAKLHSGKTELLIERLDPAASLHEATDLLADKAAEKGVLLRCEPETGLPAIAADSTRLHQVLINLISNAVKFTTAGGEVLVRAWRAPSGVDIEVADTGIGMSAEDIPKALEPFGQVENAMTRTHEGTGLGLPLAKNLVELHGGSFAIASEPGRGTAVRITFPLASEMAPPADAPVPNRSVA